MLNTPKTRTLVNRSPIFYGWVVWAVATLGIIATSPGQTFTMSLFIDDFIRDFNVGRTTISTLYGIGTLGGSLSLRWIGKSIDLHGNRLMSAIISGLFALALLAFSRVTGPIMLVVAFFAIRMLGQGSMLLVSSTVIAQWFRRRRGMVMGFSLVIFSVFRGFYVPLLQDFLDTHDWRQAMVMLGVAMGLIVFPLMWLFLRDRPEQFGLLPDGADERKPTTVILAEDNWTLAEARRTMLFWVFVMGRVMGPTFGTGLIFHQISIFDELGHAAGVAADTLGQVAFVAAFVTLIAGYMVDRLHPGRVLAIQLSALIITMGLAMVMAESWMLLAYALAFGVVHGNGGVIDGAVFANIYGRQHQGAINGFVFTFIVAGSALGPILFGLSFDFLGSYNPILWVGIALATIPLVLSFFTPIPQHDTSVAG